MERSERLWLGFLALVFLTFNAVTLSPIVPWQARMVWNRPAPDIQVRAEFADYRVSLSPEATAIRVGDYVEFVATSADVTYGFGVFRQDGRMVLQMQVLPGHQNRIMWRFDEPGVFDVRSTEYSGPRHPETFLDDAIVVTG